MKRGRFLVNMVIERDKENIPPTSPTQHTTLENDLKMSSSDEVTSKETHAALTMVDNSIPSTSRQQKTGPPNYYIFSPIRSNESDIDDSDEDPNFRLVQNSKTPSIVVPRIASLTRSSTSSSSSSSSTSNSSSDTEDDSEQADPQNGMVAENNSKNPEVERKKE